MSQPPKKKTKRGTQCCVWDFTWSQENISTRPSAELLNKECKKWAFQLEEGEGGYKHYQGRISLKVKARLGQVIDMFPKGVHWSVTSKANCENQFYVLKDETRIEGPWKSTDPYIPKQIRMIKELRPWQKDVLKISGNWSTRDINVIIDPKGNNGKSTLVLWAIANKLGQQLPACNNYKDLMRMAMNVHEATNFKTLFIDMPRGLNKEKVGAMFSAIESIKNGYLWDDRYEFKQKLIDCPAVWVFTNKTFERGDLTDDRWKLWGISNDQELVIYDEMTYKSEMVF